MAASTVPGGAPAKRKSAMSSPWTWVIVGAVALGVGAWILIRRQSAARSSSTTDTTGTSSDQTDFSGQISTLQTEIADLQSSLAQSGGGGGGGSTGTGTGAPGTTGGGTSGGGTTGSGGSGSGTGSGSGSGSGTGAGTGGGTGTVPPPVSVPPGAVKPGMPAGVRITKVTPTQVGLAWTKVPGATDYRVRATYQGKLAAQRTAATPAITIDGLTPDHTYTFHVAASNSAGIGPETNGPAQKTRRAGSTPTAQTASTAAGGKAPAAVSLFHMNNTG